MRDGMLTRLQLYSLLWLLLICAPAPVRAATLPEGCQDALAEAGVPAHCLTAAARRYRHPNAALCAILAVERGRVGQCVRNHNGTRDCGPFQINSGNFARFATRYAIPEVQFERLIREDGCFNAHIAAWMLRDFIKHADARFWEAVGRYNTGPQGSAKAKRSYQEKVWNAYKEIYGR